MTPELWECLEKLEQRGIGIDGRQKNNSAAIKNYDSLVRLRYATSTEDGPGGAFLSYKITEKGRQALTEYKKNNP